MPHALHYPATLPAAEAGRHALVEKPMATNLAETDEMIDAFRRVDVVRLHQTGGA